MSRSTSLGLLAMIVAATILRVAVLCGYESCLDTEEARGALQSVRYMRGADRGPYDPWRYIEVLQPHEPGVAVPLWIAALLFRVFGVSALCFKSVGVLLSLPILPLTYWIVARHMSRRAAGITALLMVLSPAMFAKWNVKPYYFSQTIIANLLLFELACQIVFDRKGGFLRCAALGLVAGLAAINGPFSFPMIAAVAVAWVCFGRPMLRPLTVLPAALGFALGFTPLLLMGGKIATRYFSALMARSGAAPHSGWLWALTGKLSYIFGQTAPVEGAQPHTVASLTYYAAFAASMCWLAARQAGPMARHAVGGPPPRLAKRSLLLIFLGGHIFSWALSPQEMRYLIPIFPFALVAIALAISDVRMRVVRIGMAVAVAAAGLAGILDFSQSPKRGWDKIDYWTPAHAELLDLLNRDGVTGIYTSFFIGPHVMFDSRDAITAYHRYVAWREYEDAVDRAERYAFVYQSGSIYARAIEDALARRGVQYRKQSAGGFGVWTDLRPALRLRKIAALDVATPGAAWDEEAWEASLRLDPNWTQRRVEDAEGLLLAGRVDEAMEQLDEAVRRDPEAGAAYVLMGAIYRRKGDLAKRDEMWARAVLVDPKAARMVLRLKRSKEYVPMMLAP